MQVNNTHKHKPIQFSALNFPKNAYSISYSRFQIHANHTLVPASPLRDYFLTQCNSQFQIWKKHSKKLLKTTSLQTSPYQQVQGFDSNLKILIKHRTLNNIRALITPFGKIIKAFTFCGPTVFYDSQCKNTAGLDQDFNIQFLQLKEPYKKSQVINMLSMEAQLIRNYKNFGEADYKINNQITDFSHYSRVKVPESRRDYSYAFQGLSVALKIIRIQPLDNCNVVFAFNSKKSIFQISFVDLKEYLLTPEVFTYNIYEIYKNQLDGKLDFEDMVSLEGGKYMAVISCGATTLMLLEVLQEKKSFEYKGLFDISNCFLSFGAGSEMLKKVEQGAESEYFGLESISDGERDVLITTKTGDGGRLKAKYCLLRMQLSNIDNQLEISFVQTAVGINNVNYINIYPQIDRVKKPTIFFEYEEKRLFENNHAGFNDQEQGQNQDDNEGGNEDEAYIFDQINNLAR